MHSKHVHSVSRKVGVDPAKAAADEQVTYAMFKRTAAKAVRQYDLKRVHASTQSTVQKYLSMLDPEATQNGAQFPNKQQQYLETPMYHGTRTKLLFRAGFAPVAHMAGKKRNGSSRCPFCECADETAAHFALQCNQFTAEREDMLTTLAEMVGPSKFAEWQTLPLQEQLAMLLGDRFWGDKAVSVDGIVQMYLSSIVRARAAQLPKAQSSTPAADPAGARAHGSHCYG